MVTELEKQLIQIGQRITDGTASYDDLVTLQSYKREILEMCDIQLAEQAGITEEEWNKGELNPALSYKEDFIKLEINNDQEGNVFCKIEVEDGSNVVITEPELLGLIKILKDNKEEIENYFHEFDRINPKD